ncbi:MAG TPA: glycosyltransferase family 39 protein [bacterium]|nr:glycosyltransferase family 39 protein [bacterium]
MAGSIWMLHVGQALIGWSLAIGTFVWAFRVQSRCATSPDRSFRFSAPEGALLAIVLLLAALMRLPFVGTHVTGLQADEANNLSDAFEVAFGGLIRSPFVTGWGGTPTFPDYIVGAAFKILGPECWVARSVSAFFSLGAIFFFFKWCRFWMGQAAALVASLLMAASWWFLYFSLSTFHNSILFFAEVGAFYTLENGFRTGRRVYFALAGLFAAMCVMNYVNGRSIPVMMALTILGYSAVKGWDFLKGYWKQLFLVLFAFLWLVGPYLIHATQYPGEVWGRVHADWIAAHAKETGNYFFLPVSYFWTLTTLWAPNTQVDTRFAYFDPFLDPYTGALAMLGIGTCLFNLRKSLSWVLLPGLFMGLSANALGHYDSPMAYVHSVRLSAIIPFVFLAVGNGFDWLAGFYRLFPKPRWNWLGWSASAGLVLAMALNLNVIFGHFSKDRSTWGERGLKYIQEAKILNDHYPQDQLMVESDCLSSAVYFLTKGGARFKIYGMDPPIPIPFEAKRNVMLVFEPWRLSDGGKARIQKTYPKAVWTVYQSPMGDPFLTGVEISLEDVLASQSGMAVTESLP